MENRQEHLRFFFVFLACGVYETLIRYGPFDSVDDKKFLKICQFL